MSKKAYNLCIVHNQLDKKRLDKITDYLKDFWEERIEDEHDIVLKLDFLPADQTVFLKEFKKNEDGKGIWGTKNGKDIARSLVREGGLYHQVIFMYDAEQSPDWNKAQNTENGLTSWSFYNELYTGTEYTEVEVNSMRSEGLKKGKTSTTHETMHALAKRAQRAGKSTVVDHMDSTVVDGETVAYYKNKDPYAEDGNYSRTLNSITENDAWDAVVSMERWYTLKDLLEKAQALIKAKEEAEEVKTASIEATRTNWPEYIIVHHTGGTDANPRADTSHHTAAIVRDWHVNGLGWDDIGYHWFIEKDGKVVQGRVESKNGAHAKGYNTKSIGVCLAGNFDVTLPTTAQEESLKQLLKDIQTRYPIDKSKVIPHRKVANKTCFGNRLPDDWARNLLEEPTVEIQEPEVETPVAEKTLKDFGFKELVDEVKERTDKGMFA